MKAVEQPAAETLLTAFKTIDAAERRRHASVLNYWLSIRGDKEFPPLHDLDPLELSDAGPNSGLFELISGGHDAEIRHLGEALRDDDWPERIMDAPGPSLLACIAKKLPIVAISRDFLAFEDDFDAPEGKTRCWVTLLPLSAGGAWVDYVYALVSLDRPPAKVTSKKTRAPEPEVQIEEQAEPETEELVDQIPEPHEEISEEVIVAESLQTEEVEQPAEWADEYEPGEPERPAKSGPGFSKLLDSLAGLTGFYGSQPVKIDPVLEEETPVDEAVEEGPVEEGPVEEEPVEEEPVACTPEHEDPVAEQQSVKEEVAQADEDVASATEEITAEKRNVKPVTQSAAVASEGFLQSKLAQVRAEADEARQAKLRANAALYEALSAAYDFALDAEDAPEEYLRLVEAQGLKIQLRSPMKPVVKLAFDGMCDESMIKQLEAVLAWAFEEELPRGALAQQIEAAGGIGPILGGQAKAA